MQIEIHHPALESLIQKQMATGRFKNAEDVLLETLHMAVDAAVQTPKQSFAAFLKASPLWGAGLQTERNQDLPEPACLG